MPEGYRCAPVGRAGWGRVGRAGWGRVGRAGWGRVGRAGWGRVGRAGWGRVGRAGWGRVGRAGWGRVGRAGWGRVGRAGWGRVGRAGWGRVGRAGWGRVGRAGWGRVGRAGWGRVGRAGWGRVGRAGWGRVGRAGWGRVGRAGWGRVGRAGWGRVGRAGWGRVGRAGWGRVGRAGWGRVGRAGWGRVPDWLGVGRHTGDVEPSPPPDAGRPHDEARPDLFGGGAPRSFREALRRTDSYGFLLFVLMVLIWGVIPAGGDAEGMSLVTSTLVLWTIAIALRSSDASRRQQVAALAAAVAGFVLVATGNLGERPGLEATGRVVLALPWLAAARIVLGRVFSHRVVTDRTIAGAVCVYLIAAAAFAQIYTAIDLADPQAFAPGAEPLGGANLQYFSLVTIATLGYGDITPVSTWARTLATLETVVGQFYLVVIVARLVSTFGQERGGGGTEVPPPNQ